MQQDWRNRIVGYGEEPPEDLLANAKNWRVHPKSQQLAMESVLEEVGIVQNVLVNRLTGNMLDGHMRAELAIARGQTTVPITYVELTQEEENKILASFDAVSALAVPDEAALNSLIGDIATDNTDLAAFLDGLYSETNAAALKEVKTENDATDEEEEEDKPDRIPQIRVLLAVPEIQLLEQAFVRAGAKTRGEALLLLARSFLDQDRKPSSQSHAAQ